MILTKLHLENFKKYVSKTIEFNEGLIGIIGKNGSGKSTLFEGILFALYGEAKKRGNKDILRNANASSKDAVVVELDFEFESLEYKVVREFRGKVMSANAKFYKNGELTTSGAKEVTTAIIKLTKMSKDAFMHTLFASQKELTSLSTLKNEDRKKMIRKLLGLEKIDFVEKELVEKSRELKREISAFAEVLLSEDDVKAKQTQIKEINTLISTQKEEITKQNRVLEEFKTKEVEIKKELEGFAKTKEKKQKLFTDIELVQNSIQNQIKNQKRLTQELQDLELKARELQKYEGIKQEFEALHVKLQEQAKLKEYSLKKEGLQKEQVQLTEQWKKSKADIKALQKACEMMEKYSFDAKNLEQDLSIRQDEIEAKQTIEKEIELEIAAEQRVINETNAKITHIKSLGKDSACPTCTRPLLEEYDNVIDSLLGQVQNTHQKKIEAYSTQLKTVQTQKATLVEQKKVKDKEYQELSNKINIIKSKQKDLSQAQEYFSGVEKKGIKNKEELKTLEQFSYDEALHVNIQKAYEELTPKHRHALSLETELKREKSLKVELENCTKQIAKLSLTCKAKEEEYKSVNYDEVAHKNRLQEHEKLQLSKDENTNKLNDIKVLIAKSEGEIKTLQHSLQNNEAQLKKVQTKKDDLQDYEKIKLSLSEFKTRLNSKVAPRISAIASQMYATITKGKYQHIEVSNDFDFYIYDEGKKYPIERFSGGEVDLANLVLRIAISKTLTELSGASSIGFLAFDEVFGSQDESRRMEILEAFHTIKEQYRQIFIISHEMEIKEMFERVVEV
ncbi:AAA family ATPase [Sulfurospirillum arcachonense]|uniref:AAA family ATPase n=1 Tax=Sulfurospirillum arcachonense TaxID=57666 RepID=UPI000469EF0B|nr:SMC family ATPase [Sulfurospirillum arcachonense]